MWKKVAAVLLLIAGLALIFSNQINEQVLKYRSQEITQEITEVSAEKIKENNERILPPAIEKEIYDFSQVKEASFDETWTSLFKKALEDPLFEKLISQGELTSGSFDGEDPFFREKPGSTNTDPTDEGPVESGSDPDKGGSAGDDQAPGRGSSSGSEKTQANGEPGSGGSPGSVRTTAAGERPGGEERPGSEDTSKPGTAADQGGSNKPSGNLPSMTEEEAQEALKRFTKSLYIGVIRIPKINVELGILKGVLNNNLYAGTGTMRADQAMGERNYPLAGHHVRAYGVLFNRVPELKKGDLMHMTDKEFIYTYRVYQNKKVHESDIGVIYDHVAEQHGSPVLTLVTCFNRNERDHRAIIHGELIEVKPYSDAVYRALGN